jgi:phosphate starvation-inducible PhoH-like protein
MHVVGKIEGIEFVYFDERDVVRHKLVQAIVKAYEAYGNGEAIPRVRAVGAGPSASRGD